MRSFAQTYPQLMNQAIAAGCDTDTLLSLRAAHNVAMGLTDGYPRAHGQPFLCHLVRTASIVLAEGHTLVLVEAAMNHAAYSLGTGLRHREPRNLLEARLGTKVGLSSSPTTSCHATLQRYSLRVCGTTA